MLQIYETLLQFKDHDIVEFREYVPPGDAPAVVFPRIIAVCDGPHGLDLKDSQGLG